MFGFFNKGKQADAAAEENANPTSYETTRVGLARRTVEQELLVDYFSKNPTALIDDITEEFGLSALFGNLYRQQKMRRQPYYEDEYALDLKKTEFDDYLIIAELPKPPHVGLCYRMFFTFDAPFERVALFMVEREEEGATMYMWDRDKNRTTVGFVETGPWADKSKEERAAELQMVSDAFHEGMEPPVREEPAAEADVDAEAEAEAEVEAEAGTEVEAEAGAEVEAEAEAGAEAEVIENTETEVKAGSNSE